MQTYDGTVRLGGNVLTEVPKKDMTAAEILLLQSIHGEDAVVRLKERKMDKRKHDDERQRLYAKYGEARVKAFFGNQLQKLPTKLEGVAIQEPDPDDLTDEQLAALTAPDPEE